MTPLVIYSLLVVIAVIVVLLALFEIFFLPGFGIAGVASIAVLLITLFMCGIYSNWLMFTIFLVLTLLLFALGFYIVSKSRRIDHFALHTTLNEKATDLPTQMYVGAKGKALSRLALSGKVLITGEIFEATSDKGLIDEETPIVVARIERDKIYVTPL